jgi:hypothetical protein
MRVREKPRAFNVRARARSSPMLCHFITYGVADDGKNAVGNTR